MHIGRYLLALALLGGAACDGNSNPSGITLSTTELACPSETLELTIDGGFPSDTRVTFRMGSTVLDGSPVVLNDGSIACGLPSDAAPGTYGVLVDGDLVGQVTLDSTDCPPSR